MSISQLPPELLRAILECNEGEDHLRTCLVSKLWYQETVPLLYEGVSFLAAEYATRVWYDTIFAVARGDWAAGTLNLEMIHEKHKGFDKQHHSIIEVFRRHPSYKNYIKRAIVQLYINDPAAEDDTFIADVVQVLRESRNLRDLTLENFHRHDDPDEWHIQWILSHIPSSVTVLDLSGAFLSAETILGLLARLPNLKELTLAADFTLGDWRIRSPTPSPKLPYLEGLTLNNPFNGKHFLEKILSASPSLDAIYASPVSLRALPLGTLSSISQLVVQGDFTRSAFGAYSPSEFVSDLITTLARCQKLQHFVIVATEYFNEEEKEETEEEEDSNSLNLEISTLLVQFDFLRHLPSSVTALGIIDTAIAPEYLANYLEDTSLSTQIEILRFSPLKEKWFGADQDEREAREDTVVDVCDEREIWITWVENGQRTIRQCSRKREMAMIEELEKEFASFKLVPKNQEQAEEEEDELETDYEE
ncbi:hypothetical protein JCM3765_007265 [Sporobolomyces pararoseus]